MKCQVPNCKHSEHDAAFVFSCGACFRATGKAEAVIAVYQADTGCLEIRCDKCEALVTSIEVAR